MENETPLDPFAVDFFGVGASAPAVEDEEFASPEDFQPKKKRRSEKRPDWFAKLPKFTRREVEFSNILNNLPANLLERAAQKVGSILAHYTFTSPENVSCTVISNLEIDLTAARAQISKSPQIFLNLGSEKEKNSADVIFNTDFAASIINLTLGGKGAETGSGKNLSPIERTILEFLAVNIFAEINEPAKHAHFRLQSVEENPPPPSDSHERGIEVVFRVDFPAFSGIATLLASRDFLEIIKRREQKLAFGPSQFSPSIDLRLLVGTTSLAADSSLFLEKGDVILIENPAVRQLNDLAEIRQFYVGGGTNTVLSGNFIDEDFSQNLNFKVTDFNSEAARHFSPFAKFTMDVNENDFPEPADQETPDEPAVTDEIFDAENLNALENVQVNLRVEIAGDRLSLRELQNLRAGQIIALGCRPTDPVRLVTDSGDQPVAIGELVEIEGQLGVRLTKIFI